jgi:DNA-binding NtrC family response regulator
VNALIVDDELSIREVLQLSLKRSGWTATLAANFQEASQAIAAREFDLVLTDLQLPDGDGIEVLRMTRDRWPETPVIVITAHGSADTAVAAMKLGASDYLTKPFDLDELAIRIQQVSDGRTLRRENRLLKAEAQSRDLNRTSGIIGKSPGMKALLDRARAVAPTLATVLILGESGTGKELVARAIHGLSQRRGPFVPVNCGALTETLLETELFGHVRGAFTDARMDKPGLIEEAHQGTLFLDEIGETSLGMQVKLLRVLQERKVKRVGSSEEKVVDLRVVAATHRDLTTLVQQGDFREDLFYRINVIPLQVPALRDRLDDLPSLVAAFLARFSAQLKRPEPRISAAALAALARHSWPGNVRELENAVERAVVLEPGSVIGPDAFAFHEPYRAIATAEPSLGAGFSLPDHLRQIERHLVGRALSAAQGNRKRAAGILGVNERALRHILSKQKA